MRFEPALGHGQVVGFGDRLDVGDAAPIGAAQWPQSLNQRHHAVERQRDAAHLDETVALKRLEHRRQRLVAVESLPEIGAGELRQRRIPTLLYHVGSWRGMEVSQVEAGMVTIAERQVDPLAIAACL